MFKNQTTGYFEDFTDYCDGEIFFLFPYRNVDLSVRVTTDTCPCRMYQLL